MELGGITSSIETGEIQPPKSPTQFPLTHPMNEQIYHTGSGAGQKFRILKYHSEIC